MATTNDLIPALAGDLPKFPKPYSLRRTWPWKSHHRPAHCLRTVAIHEAGHQVIAEWLGLQVTSTTATPTHGLMSWTADFSAAAAAPPPDPDDQRVLLGTAVSLLHAGVVAERLAAGLPLDCALYYPDQVDFQAAETMLKPTFGAMSSAAHGYAQRVAAHVLHGRWDRVREVAKVLIERGQWASPQKTTA